MKSSKFPLVSVLLCVYNGEDYIRDSIDSVLNQSYKNFELVIVNDSSTDKTDEIIQSYTDRRIKYIRNEKNLRLQGSLNKGLNYCDGEFVARMDADDVCILCRFSEQVSFLQKNPEIAVVGSAVQLIDEQGQNKSVVFFPEKPALVHWSLFFYCCLAHPSVMFRRSLIELGLVYDENRKLTEDFDLWSRACQHYKLANTKSVLLKLRKHRSNVSFDTVNAFPEIIDISSKMMEASGIGVIPSHLIIAFNSGGDYKNARDRELICIFFWKVYYYLKQTKRYSSLEIKHLKAHVAEKVFEVAMPAKFSPPGMFTLVKCIFKYPSLIFIKLRRKF